MNTKPHRAILLDGKTNLQSITFLDQDGIEQVAYTEDTLEGYLASRFPRGGYLILPFEEAVEVVQKRQEEQYCSPPIEVTAEQWDDALNVLPPRRWRHDGHVEGFCMSEFLTGNLTAHYFRVGGKYYVATRPFPTPYNEIAKETPV